jgi:type 1 glutamine amidotransferase
MSAMPGTFSKDVETALTDGLSENGFAGTDEERQLIEQAVPAEAPTPPAAGRKLLVVTLNVRDGKVGRGHKAIGYANLAIELMGSRTGAYETVFSNDVSMFEPATLGQFGAICFNNTCGVLFEDEGLRRSLLDFVAGGKGFVGIHAAAATFVQYPEYGQFPPFGEMLGAYENGGHPWKPDETITLKVDDPESPINAAFEGQSFEVQDEVFQFQEPYSREKLHVLLSIDTERTDMAPSRHFLPERAADGDFAMSWIRQYGEGRVFYSSLGHNPQLFWDRRVLAHFLAGIQFALGDLDADATPSSRAGES